MKSSRFFDRGVWCCARGAGSLLARAFFVALLGLLLLLGRSPSVADSEPPPAPSVTESTESAQDAKPQSDVAKTPEVAKSDSAATKSDTAAADAIPEHPDFHKQIEPILVQYCYECHGDGEKKGQVAFDELKTDDQILHNPELWYKALRNVRSNIMPPEGNDRPNDHEKRLLAQWIKYTALGIDPKDPDPGRVTLRRLNRVEYHNTIHDLLGYDYKTTEEFPADDTGYGFDNIGDVLTVSPLLLEKYLQAAETIITAAVPTVAKTTPERILSGGGFGRGSGRFGGGGGGPMSFYKSASVPFSFDAKHAGTYRVIVEVSVHGQFEFDPGRVRMTFKAGDEEKLNEEFGWNENKKFHYEFEEKLEPGEHALSLNLEPLTPAEKKINSLDMDIVLVKVVGPLEKEFQVPAKGYDRFFFKPDPPTDAAERLAYAREIISRFAKQAFRRPADDGTLDRLAGLAETTYRQPDKKFEEGIQRALIAMLSSPRFLFRIEEPEAATAGEAHPPIDEYSLASRLSYFLWSSMPDDELMHQADKGELRKNLHAQVARMLKDSRSDAFIQNFVGQWLQVRDIEGVSINEQAVIAREDDELRKLMDKIKNATNDFDRRAAFRQLRFRPNKIELNGDLRRAMQQEVEMLFAYILHEDRSALDLIDCNYTFLNEKLAQHYGVPGVQGPQMRRVELPKDSVRGGILTTGAFLVVTSNPDRTSPVKRGLFILDNIIGCPPPPPPGNVPQLEDSEKDFKDHEPTLREVLEVHRKAALCSSCHSRLDPLGLGFEHFNALGMWREKERGQPIESKGLLSTGESFENVHDLKHILLDQYRQDFYRCFTEKVFTYALGRGLTYDDVHSVDQIVDHLEQENGKISAVLNGIVDSAEFQKRRNQATPTN